MGFPKNERDLAKEVQPTSPLVVENLRYEAEKREQAQVRCLLQPLLISQSRTDDKELRKIKTTKVQGLVYQAPQIQEKNIKNWRGLFSKQHQGLITRVTYIHPCSLLSVSYPLPKSVHFVPNLSLPDPLLSNFSMDAVV